MLSAVHQKLTGTLTQFERTEMSKFYDKTTMGGDRGAFQTTRWTDIYQAITNDEVLRSAIVGNPVKKYWKPVYCRLKRKGYSNESAATIQDSRIPQENKR